MSENTILKKKNPASVRITSAFLALVVILTAGLYGYNFMLQNKQDTLQEELSTVDKSIKELKSDKEIQVALLLQQNKKILSDMDAKTNFPFFINHLRSIERAYDVAFEGFNFAGDAFTTQARFQSKTSEELAGLKESKKQAIAYQEAVRFIKEYRSLEKSDFTLGFINSIQGTDEIKFLVKMELK